ncbi:MAG: hypothetical protein KC766_08560, partial [Myxococcales bacterium]|nr:hypothetical protein [Myxococcales bacterium]
MAMLKIRARATALASVLPFAIIGFAACSSDPAQPEEAVGSSTQAAINAGSGPSCHVELTKVNYDDEGTETGNFIELHVVRDPDSPPAVFLGDCGMGIVRHVNGANCGTAWDIDVSNTTIPNDDYLVICGKDGIGTDKSQCDVFGPTADLLQNGAPDALKFLDTNAKAFLDVWWEGSGSCSPVGSSSVSLQTDTGATPDLTNIACNDAFTLVETSTLTLRQPNPCPATDAGTDGSAGAGGTGGAGGSSGASTSGGTGGTSASGGSPATGGVGGTLGSGGSGGSGTGTGATGGFSSGTGGSLPTGGTGGTLGSGGSGGTGTSNGGSAGTGSGTGGTGTATGGSAGTGTSNGGSAGTGSSTGGSAGTASGTGGTGTATG